MSRYNLIILCHPNKKSFCHGIAAEISNALLKQGEQVVVEDLYDQGFNPVLTLEEDLQKTSLEANIQRHFSEVISADRLIWIFPDWWGQPPALLKGWLDRVLRPGVAFDFQGEYEDTRTITRRFTGKEGITFMTSDNSRYGISSVNEVSSRLNWYSTSTRKPAQPEHGKSEDVKICHLENIWRDAIGNFTGLTLDHFVVFGPMRESSYHQRQKWLAQACAVVTSFPHKQEE